MSARAGEQIVMLHYVCTGDCGGESQRVGVCESEGCSKEAQTLTECNCEDGFHKGVVTIADEPDIESMDDQDSI